MSKPELICVFGDSTAWGAWDLEKGGWVNRLWFHLAKNNDEHYCELYNLSISGGTTYTILDRFESEAKIRNADALIFQSGGNDAAILGKDGPIWCRSRSSRRI
jgi:lysophospholipase L1-like esterase